LARKRRRTRAVRRPLLGGTDGDLAARRGKVPAVLPILADDAGSGAAPARGIRAMEPRLDAPAGGVRARSALLLSAPPLPDSPGGARARGCDEAAVALAGVARRADRLPGGLRPRTRRRLPPLDRGPRAALPSLSLVHGSQEAKPFTVASPHL